MPVPLGSEKVSQMPDAGSLNGGELIPLVRVGSPNLNFRTTSLAIAELGGGGGAGLTLVKLDNSTTYTLANGSVVNQQFLIVDNLGNGNATITGTFSFGSTITIKQPGQAIWAIWDGTEWIAPSWVGTL